MPAGPFPTIGCASLVAAQLSQSLDPAMIVPLEFSAGAAGLTQGDWLANTELAVPPLMRTAAAMHPLPNPFADKPLVSMASLLGPSTPLFNIDSSSSLSRHSFQESMHTTEHNTVNSATSDITSLPGLSTKKGFWQRLLGGPDKTLVEQQRQLSDVAVKLQGLDEQIKMVRTEKAKITDQVFSITKPLSDSPALSVVEQAELRVLRNEGLGLESRLSDLKAEKILLESQFKELSMESTQPIGKTIVDSMSTLHKTEELAALGRELGQREQLTEKLDNEFTAIVDEMQKLQPDYLKAQSNLDGLRDMGYSSVIDSMSHTIFGENKQKIDAEFNEYRDALFAPGNQ